MSFYGPYPYGTPGGYERDTPQYQGTPGALPVVQADGRGFVSFLTLNGPLATYDPNSLTVLTRNPVAGVTIVALTVLENGASVDTNVGTIDAQAGIRAFAVSPGTIALEIPTNGLALAMIPDGLITSAKLAGAIAAAKLAGGILASQLAGGITGALITDGSLDGTELAAGAIVTALIATGAVGETQLGAPAGVRFGCEAYRDAATSGAVNVTSTTGAVILSDTIVLPNDGKRWYFRVDVGGALNAPNAQFIRIAGAVNDGSGDLLVTPYLGTGTVGGERWNQVGQLSSVIGSGQTLTFQLRAKVTGGTGSIASASLVGEATNKSFKGN